MPDAPNSARSGPELRAIGLAAAVALLLGAGSGEAAASSPGTTLLGSSPGTTMLAYRVARATATERVDFASDPATCAPRGLCGYAGNVTYSYDFRDGFADLFRTTRPNDIFGVGFFVRGAATTRSAVRGPAASVPCTDTVGHRRDEFTVSGSGRRLVVTFHDGDPDGVDYLDTRCPGPREFDLARSGALPSPRYRLSHFRHRRVVLAVTRRYPFKDGGFAGTADWHVRVVLLRERLELPGLPQLTG